MLTWFGSGGRSEDSDHQQDEEEQAEDPHGCVSNLVNSVFQNLGSRAASELRG